ncbi:MAG: hypothetical protein V1816_12855 [Pseudomonadota bacterium]
MKKIVTMVVVTVLALLTAALPGGAQNSGGQASLDDKELSGYAGESRKVLTKELMDQLLSVMDDFKAAGASFQPSLLVPVEKAGSYKSDGALRVMNSLYYIDSIYAIIFKKNQIAEEYLKIGDDLYEKIIRRTCPEAAINPSAGTGKLLRAMNEYSFAEIRRDLADDLFKENEELMKSTAGAVLLADSTYGAIIESFHLSTQAVLISDGEEEMIKLINRQLSVTAKMMEFFNIFKKSPAYSKLVGLDERREVIDHLTGLAAKEHISLEDVKGLNSLIAPVREKMINTY